MFTKIALKELKQIKRDKKNFIFNIILPLLMIIIIAASTGVIYTKAYNEKSKFTILTNSNYIQDKFEADKNYNIKVINDVDNISNEVKKSKNELGVLYDNDKASVTFIINSDSKDEIAIIQDNVLKTIQLDTLSSNQTLDVKTESIMVKTNYEPITLKLTAAICAFLVLLFSFRLNNVNTFYLTTNEKSSGVLELMLSAPIRAIDIVLGKWIANFTSCLVLTLAVLLPVYFVLILLFEVFLNLNIKLVSKLPLVIFEVILLCIITSIFQLFLGFIAKSTKQAQMYLAYSPLVLLLPLSIIFGLDIKSLSSYILQNYVIDFIPILNFYDLIQISVLGIINFNKLIIIFFTNIAFLLVILKKLVKLFNSERILFFKN